MTEQKETYKNFIEDVAHIWLEYLIAYSENGLNMEEEVTDPNTGEQTVQIVNVPQSALEQLQATVRIDITPKSVYDKFAQEQTIENLMIQGFFNAQRVGELAIYADILDDDAVAPKMKIQEAVERIREEQRRIAMIEAQAQQMQQRANQFLMGDPEEQSSMMADSMMQMQEAQFAQQEQALDEQVPVESEEQ
jgi:CheY-like chemotaxis protein